MDCVRTLILLVIGICSISPALGCSLVSCINAGRAMRHTFQVRIRRDKRAVPGVTVEVTGSGRVVFSAKTNADGMVQIRNLPQGEYWLTAELLGIGAANQCFHVSAIDSLTAKGRATFTWGEFPPETRGVAGKLTEFQPGTSTSPLWNLLHGYNRSVAGVKLTLHEPFTGKTYEGVSNPDGTFSLGDVPEGIYVLHVEGGDGLSEYEPTDMAIRVNPRAVHDELMLRISESGCGGRYVSLDRTPASR